MNAVIHWLERAFAALPLPLLEVWGRVSYLIGLGLAICAFGGITFRLGSGWGFGRERQSWDARAVLSISLTFLLVVTTGYVGSFVVLVPGAQTFESLKDLVVFLCVVLFGYPALITIPFAYGLSDLLEGVPPDSLMDWLLGYFINPACFWVAYQLFGKCPDFRKAGTWGRYLLFVLIFASIEPVLWGFICADKFTPEISYRAITPALFFTTSITWLLAPPAMLIAFPVARRLWLFWAEIPGHVTERAFGNQAPVWEAGREGQHARAGLGGQGVPIRMFLLTPFIALVLVMVGMTAYVTLWSAESDATKLAVRLHQEIAQNMNLQLDDYLARLHDGGGSARAADIEHLLQTLPIAAEGRAFIIDRTRTVVASSAPSGDPIIARALASLVARAPLEQGAATDFRIVHVTARPLSRETWLAHAARYQDRRGGHDDWVLVTVMPERLYLAGVRTGRSRSAMVFSIALLLSLAVAAILAAMVGAPLRRLSNATRALAQGGLAQRVPSSRLEELGALAQSFNDMAARLELSFDELVAEVETRKRRECALEESETRLRASEERAQLAIKSAHFGVWDWDVQSDHLVWDDSMYDLYGLRKEEFSGAYEAWTSCLVSDDVARATGDVQAALRGEREFASDFRVRRGDGSVHVIRGVAHTVRGEDGHPVRMVGFNWDVTEELRVQEELRRHRVHLEELVDERTAALSVAVRQAEAANRAKSSFLANMSHEIRTPMNAILGYAQLLKLDGTLAESQRHKVETIHASGNHLLTVINDILEMSKIEAGRATLVVVSFDLRALLDELTVMFAALIDPRRVALSVAVEGDVPAVVEGDAGKVRQVIINLLSNAAKFTADGSIRVATSSSRAANDRIRIVVTVTDTGSGMASADLARIFNAFDQLDAGARLGGSGLGLTISRSYAQLMHGDLTAASEPGQGSTFTFSFEAGVAVGPAAVLRDNDALPSGLAPGEPRRRILVVDDVAANRDIAAGILSRVGFDVRVAVSGADAVAMYGEWRPDLVLMDLRMPGEIDGLEAIRRLRAAGATEVMVAFTASSAAEAEQAAFAAGADALIRKPCRAAELLERVGALLAVRYQHEPAPPVAAEAAATPSDLSTMLAGLAPELIEGLREAAVGARAARIRVLADEVAQHSSAAAVEIRALVDRFDYETLLAALAAVRTPS